MRSIVITGATGLVGSRIVELLSNDFGLAPLSSSDIDITDKRSVLDCLENANFDILIHLAGYTNVDGAETEKEKAHEINALGTKNVFETVQSLGKKMIYISTDFVFDGKTPPYDETSEPNPIGYYGQTKYEGEQIVKGNAMIVRISYPYLSFWNEERAIESRRKQAQSKPDFVQRLRQLLEEGRELQMITDGSMTPTHIDDIAHGLKYLIHNFSPEIYHLVGGESLSPYEVGKRIAKKFDLDDRLVQPITYEEFMKGKAQRPQFSTIVSRKNNFHKMRQFSP